MQSKDNQIRKRGKNMKKESEAILLRIFIGEDDKYEGKLLYKYILEFFKKEKMAGVTILRGMEGFGKSSHLHTTSILRLSSDLPIVIECVDKKENIEKIKPRLVTIIKEGLITEEKVKIILYESNKKI
jgi:uncharacterized protein